ncbi:hypothetical protein AYI68_g1318 [Smittium mucronatum]|uniref:Uncharacterized protein n=1 Tax=Smittium mucronatum TaxID=133383 RepID=A0A1R0H5U4_9FUNG|nr:hypothetical protein AYI68_g1318 [Smittium mucronatum]
MSATSTSRKVNTSRKIGFGELEFRSGKNTQAQDRNYFLQNKTVEYQRRLGHPAQIKKNLLKVKIQNHFQP